MSADPEAIGMPCEICSEPIVAGEYWQTLTVIIDESNARSSVAHRECLALGIIGHAFGVCSCTGYGHDRAAALELRRRLIEKRPGRSTGRSHSA